MASLIISRSTNLRNTVVEVILKYNLHHNIIILETNKNKCINSQYYGSKKKNQIIVHSIIKQLDVQPSQCTNEPGQYHYFFQTVNNSTTTTTSCNATNVKCNIMKKVSSSIHTGSCNKLVVLNSTSNNCNLNNVINDADDTNDNNSTCNDYGASIELVDFDFPIFDSYRKFAAGITNYEIQFTTIRDIMLQSFILPDAVINAITTSNLLDENRYNLITLLMCTIALVKVNNKLQLFSKLYCAIVNEKFSYEFNPEKALFQFEYYFYTCCQTINATKEIIILNNMDHYKFYVSLLSNASGVKKRKIKLITNKLSPPNNTKKRKFTFTCSTAKEILATITS